MRYSLGNGVIRSENTAKSIAQAGSYLTQFIGSHEQVNTAIDYGCGKLRYALTLSRICGKLVLVDSAIQLNRQQKLAGSVGTIRDFAGENLSNAVVRSVEEFEPGKWASDFTLCANVLSAIPSEEDRNTALQLIRSSLAAAGEALFVTQYTNSYFRAIQKSGRTIPHLDGWLVSGKKRVSYYGAINKDRLVSLLAAAGFGVRKAWISGQSAYVLCSRDD